MGICGGIAAYKVPLLIRLFKKAGAEVQVIITASALDFVTAPTLSVLSERPVLKDFIANESGSWNNHVELGLWADALVIAPLTANTLAKMSHGICDNLLMAVYLSMRGKTWVAPAMDLDMMVHPTTETNLQLLKKHGVTVIDAKEGPLASGLVGKGRMAEPEEIFEEIKQAFALPFSFESKKILITAGPTYEKIDPVRFIGNHSSGKMGYAIAETFQKAGAEVHLVSGPSKLAAPQGVKISHVTTADEMLEACLEDLETYDIAIMSAAVADFKPSEIATQKIKKGDQEGMQIQLIKNPDILKHFGAHKKSNQTLVGFALETEHEIENANKKLVSKNADLIVLNTLNEAGSGFNTDTNAVWLITKNNEPFRLDMNSKTQIAMQIAEFIYQKNQNIN